MLHQRQLAAIMFTDIEGYTAAMQQSESKAIELRERHRQVIKQAHQEFNGRIVQYYGDGTLSIFHSSVNAVECAVEMQIEYKKDPEVPVRIGIHVGDISYDGVDAFGDGLNVAARIEPICEPSGVFISERVFEDIRNHAWLQAIHVGNYQLKNIPGDTPLYAISSKGMALPVVRNLKVPPQQQNHRPQNQGAKSYQTTTVYQEGKSKSMAAILALLLGLWGVHRFYLGKRFLGIANFAAFFLAMAMVIEEGFPWFLIMLAILSVVEGILFAVMPQSEFDAKYNNSLPTSRKERKAMQKEEKKRQPEAAQTRKSRGNFIIKDAFIAYRSGNYDQARKYFEDALQYDYNDPQTHFMLSCCHSMANDSKQAYFHLASAVDFGFQEFEEIYHNEALVWLRAQPDFDTFVKNGYRQVAYLSTPAESDLLETKSYYDTTMLDKIADLGELLERGVISRDDFESQKKSILGY